MATRSSGRRAQARAEMEAAILAEGRRQLAERGAAALSLREIARSIGVVSSAVYRYVDSRDALLTLLVADAYTQLAHSVEKALGTGSGAGSGSDDAEPLATLAHAMRDWGLRHPEQWGLIYGAPVPGYVAPEDVTSAPGMRVMTHLLEIMRAIPVSESRTPSIELDQFLRAGSDGLGVPAAPDHSLAAVRAWCTIVGTISMEIFGQLGQELASHPGIGREILDDQIRVLTDERAGQRAVPDPTSRTS